MTEEEAIREEAISACKEITDSIISGGYELRHVAALLSMCSAHFLGGAAAAFNNLAAREGRETSEEEMVRATANIIVDLSYGAKQ